MYDYTHRIFRDENFGIIGDIGDAEAMPRISMMNHDESTYIITINRL